MNHTKYLSLADESFRTYHFISQGPKGPIRKKVIYTETEFSNVYNLAFGDYDPNTNTIDDFAVTNNGDSSTVLATVASTVQVFMNQHPKAWILVTGSTPARTRLYRMGITNNLTEIPEHFVIFGKNSDGNWRPFVIGDTYDAFLITKKETNTYYEKERNE